MSGVLLGDVTCPIYGCQSRVERDRGALIKHLIAEHGLALIETIAYLDRLLPSGEEAEDVRPEPPKKPAARTPPCSGAPVRTAPPKIRGAEPPATKVRPPSKRSVMMKEKEARRTASAELNTRIRERFGRTTNQEMASELGVSVSNVKGRIRCMVQQGELMPDAPVECPHCHEEVPLNTISRHTRLCGSNPERFITEVEKIGIRRRGKASADPSSVIHCPIEGCDCVRSGRHWQHRMLDHLMQDHGIRAEDGRKLLGLPTKEEVWTANLNGGLKLAPLEEAP